MPNNIILPTRFLNTPLLVSADEANLMLQAAAGNAVILPGAVAGEYTDGGNRWYRTYKGVAIIPILGGITYRGFGWYWSATYENIRSAFRRALQDLNVNAIVFDIDSPGGEAGGCFDLVDDIYKARGQKPVYAIANELCLSAAYAIASACDKIHATRTAVLGSIGVIALHYEQSKRNEKEGDTYTAIFKGAHKNDFSPHAPLSDEARAYIAASVDDSYELFCKAVARNRGIGIAAVKSTQAAIYRASEAVTAGLADSVTTVDAAMDAIVSATKNKKKGAIVMEPKEVKTELAAMIGDPSTREAAHQLIKELGFAPLPDQATLEAKIREAAEAGRREGGEAATARAVSVIEACGLSGMEAMCAGLVKEGVSLEAAQTRITEAKASVSNGFQVNGATTPTGTGQVSALLVDARRRAGITA